MPPQWFDSCAESTRSGLRVSARACTWVLANCFRGCVPCEPGLADSLGDRFLLETSFLALLDIVAVGVAVALDVASNHSNIFRVGPVLHDGLERSPCS